MKNFLTNHKTFLVCMHSLSNPVVAFNLTCSKPNPMQSQTKCFHYNMSLKVVLHTLIFGGFLFEKALLKSIEYCSWLWGAVSTSIPAECPRRDSNGEGRVQNTSFDPPPPFSRDKPKSLLYTCLPGFQQIQN